MVGYKVEVRITLVIRKYGYSFICIPLLGVSWVYMEHTNVIYMVWYYVHVHMNRVQYYVHVHVNRVEYYVHVHVNRVQYYVHVHVNRVEYYVHVHLFLGSIHIKCCIYTCTYMSVTWY